MLLPVAMLAAAAQAAPADLAAAGRSTFRGSGHEVTSIPVKPACRASGLDYATNTAPTTRAAVKKLGDLPPADHTLTVLRSVDGCPVSSTVRFNVDLSPRR